MNPTKFTPKPSALPSLESLESFSEVTADDVDNAVKAWRDKPPDRKFSKLLEATDG